MKVNLLRILSAARFRVLTKGRIYHARCPKTICWSRGSLRHLPERYERTPRAEFAVEGVQFLVHMARTSLAPEDRQMIPYLLEFEPDLSPA